jgi:circadian clock protein KaiB
MPTGKTSGDASVSDELQLRLYVAGNAPNSLLAVANLRAALTHLETQPALAIVDVLDDPEGAHEDGVLVTPTLIKVAPPPERRIVGNLRNRAALMALLASNESGP